MKVGIVSSDKSEWHVKQLQEELSRRGVENYVFPATRFLSRIDGEPKVSNRGYRIDDFDSVIVRKIPGGNPEQVFYRMDVLHRLEDLGIYVLNPSESIERAVDKFYTSALLGEAGIRTPCTTVTERFDEAMNAFDELGGDVVVKPLFGSLGVGITRLCDRDTAYRVFRALEMVRCVYYLQEFIPHGNRDLRAFVVDKEVVASMVREAKDWKTNISGGASAKPYQIEEEIAELSIKASETIGLDYTGVDLLRSEEDGSIYVVEVNSTPGWKGLQTVADVNISAKIVDFLLTRIG